MFNKINFSNLNKKLDKSLLRFKYYTIFEITLSLQNFKKKYQNTTNLRDSQEKIAGRVISIRKMSKNLTFMDLSSNYNRLQVVFDIKNFQDKEDGLIKIKRGDILGVEGNPFLTKSGELSLLVKQYEIITKCYGELPVMNRDDKEMITDHEVKYSKRYLDLMVNKKNKDIFYFRSNLIKFIRNFLEKEGFIEVETPILSNMAGGALASPFKTYSNAIKSDLYLRVAPELFLKKLIVAGYERVFEIGKNFRNEDISVRHNPEFTSVELYKSYSNYLDLIEFTKKFFKELQNDLKISELNKNINFDNFQVFDVIEELEKYFNRKINFFKDEMFYSDLEKMYEDYNKVSSKQSISVKKKIESLIEYIIEPKCDKPSFIINHPTILSPLAKSHPNNKLLSERFEFFIKKIEIINSYTELDNHIEQRERFLEQKSIKNNYENEELHPMDEDFIEALSYGMPPTAGWGLGIDRLCMLLLEQANIKDVILFPLMNVKKN